MLRSSLLGRCPRRPYAAGMWRSSSKEIPPPIDDLHKKPNCCTLNTPVSRPSLVVRELMVSKNDAVQLGLLTGVFSVQQFGSGLISACIPAYVTAIGFPGSVGFIIALPSLAAIFLNLPGGVLVDVVGRKQPLIAGTILTGFGILGMAAVGGLATAVASRLAIGVGASLWWPALRAYQGDIVGRFSQYKRGRALGGVCMATSIAYAVGPLVGGALVSNGSITLPLVLAGGSMLLTVPLLHYVMESSAGSQHCSVSAATPASTPSTASVITRVPAASAPPNPPFSTRGSARDLQDLVRDPRQQAILVSNVVHATVMSACHTIVPLYAISTYAATPLQIGSLFSIIGVLGFFGAPIGGWMADTIGRVPTVQLGSAMCGTALAAMPFCDSHIAVLAAVATAGLGYDVLGTAYTALANDVTPVSRRGIQSALACQVSDVVCVISPIGLTSIATVASYDAAFGVAASTIGGCMFFFARKSSML